MILIDNISYDTPNGPDTLSIDIFFLFQLMTAWADLYCISIQVQIPYTKCFLGIRFKLDRPDVAGIVMKLWSF